VLSSAGLALPQVITNQAAARQQQQQQQQVRAKFVSWHGLPRGRALAKRMCKRKFHNQSHRQDSVSSTASAACFALYSSYLLLLC
jgi:hypothetical protein